MKRNKFIELLFLSILITTSISYAQINPDNDNWIKKLENFETFDISKSNLFNHKLVKDFGIPSKKITDFDSVLAYRFQYAFDSIMVANNIIGASVAIDMPEKGVWQGVYGMSEPASNDSITSDMLFDIGSNTKLFVSTLILLLAEDGLLTLDDAISDWLPSYSNINGAVTIRQLLNHTSGISCYNNENPAFNDLVFSNCERIWTPEECLSYVLEPNFAPGTSWSYSNTNYILAGMIIKEAAGVENVSIILHDKILDPLSLSSTFLDIEETLVGDLANDWMYISNQNQWLDYTDYISANYSPYSRNSPYSAFWTCGGMVADSEDMAKWIKALYSGQILNQSSMDQLFNVVPSTNYGLGTIYFNWLGEEVWRHGGDTFSFGSQAFYIPRLDVSITVLVNQRTFNPNTNLYNPISEVLLAEVIDYYEAPYDKVYPHSVNLSSTYIEPNNDLLTITSEINNLENHMIEVYGKITSRDSTYIESIMLYDDGLHNDSLAGDLIFGNSFNTIPVEKEFDVSIHTIDLETNYEDSLIETYQFTTIGPLVLEDYTASISDSGTKLYVYVTLKNESNTETIEDPSISLFTEDSIFNTNTFFKPFPDISPGESETKRVTCHFIDGFIPTDILEVSFSADIFSRNYFYGTNEFTVLVDTEISEVQIPRELELYQNYPNPFNPITTIQYSIPEEAEIELKIYNTLGKEVATIVKGNRSAGLYSVKFDGSNLSSGIYMYNLILNNKNVAQEKMILVK